ncbi:MAG: hypothetical protein V7L29_28605 [Nostoc sp.]
MAITQGFSSFDVPAKTAQPADRVKNCVITLSNWLNFTALLEKTAIAQI